MIEDAYTLSPMQRGMLATYLSERRPGLEVEQILCEIAEDVEPILFERAWLQVIQRHTILRTRFCWKGLAEPRQEVLSNVDFGLSVMDWRNLSANEQEARWEAFLQTERMTELDLRTAPPMRVALVLEGGGRSKFCWTVHHIVIDGRGIVEPLRELFIIYDALRAGNQPTLAAALPFRKYIDWLQRADFSGDEAFWRDRLRGFEAPTPLTVDGHVEGLSSGERRGELRIELSAEVTAELASKARKQRLTVNTLLQGAWASLLHRYSGGDDIVYGVVRACRHSTFEGSKGLTGLCINTVPMRVRIPADARALPWLTDLQDQWTSILDHEHAPLASIRRWSNMSGASPLFETAFSYQDTSWGQAVILRLPKRAAINFGLRSQPNFPLLIDAYGGRRLRIGFLYDRARLADSAISRMAEHFQVLLKGLTADLTGPLSSLPLLTDAEYRQIVVDWNDTTTDYPRDCSIHELFEAQVLRTSDAPAVAFQGEEVTYRELNTRSNRLARLLRDNGVRPGHLVGVCLERSIEMIATLLAVLKAGAAYVPLDPKYPRERLAFMIEDARLAALVTAEHLRGALPTENVRVVTLGQGARWMEEQASDDLGIRMSADASAYVIYTSGSTGKPKGTTASHRGVIRLVRNINYADLASDQVFFQFAPISFDASTFEIWGSLLNGAKLVVCPPRTPSLQELGEIIRDNRVTTLWLPSALFKVMVEANCESLAGLKQIIAGGDVLPISAVRKFRREVLGCRLINGYGPTENTTFTACYTIEDDAESETRVPIGRPISNTQVYILDPERRPVPVGVPGELYIGGDGLAHGYLHREELTARSFVPNPFSATPGAHLYRTGDRVRYRCDGNIDFLGRRDDQVKIRGFRIELGEIESVLRGHPGLADAIVIADDGASAADRQLIAYVVPKSYADSLPDLRRFVGERLPDYMIPAAFVALPELPISPAGKVDRRALLKPTHHPASRFVAPRTQTEEIVAAVWGSELNLPAVGVNDNFFELGGDSLLAMSVVVGLSRAFNLDLKPSLLFEKWTVAEVGATIDALAGGSAPPVTHISRAPRDQPLPLSFYQERVWHHCQAAEDQSQFVADFEFRVEGVLNVQALRDALSEIMLRHELLRTTIATSDGVPVQIVQLPAPFNMSLRDVSDAPFPVEAAQRLSDEEIKRPFDMSRDFGLRILLLRLAPKDHVLVFSAHHLIYGDALREVFFHELRLGYEAFCRKEVPSLPEPLQYADFAVWQRKNLRADADLFQTQVAFWDKQLSGMKPLRFPFARPRPPAVQNLSESKLQSELLPPAIVKDLLRLAAKSAATSFVVLLAVFKALLVHRLGQSDIALGTYVSKRGGLGLETMLGQTTNLVILRTDLSGDPDFEEVIRRVRDVVFDAHRHQDVPFEELSRELQTREKEAPSVNAVFQYTRLVRHPLQLAGLKNRKRPNPPRKMPWGFTVGLIQAPEHLWMAEDADSPSLGPPDLQPSSPDKEGIRGYFEFDTDLYDPSGVRDMVSDYEAVLKSVLADPMLRLSELDRVLASSARRQADHLQLRASLLSVQTEAPLMSAPGQAQTQPVR